MSTFSVDIKLTDKHPTIYLHNAIENTTAEIFAFGAILNSFIISSNNKGINLVDGFTNNIEAITDITNGFKSAFLSPFTCRMNKGNYYFNEQLYSTTKFFLQPHAIHGLLYDAVYTIKSSKATNTEATVVLEYTYSATENGYPFFYTIQHYYSLQQHNKLSITSTITNNSNTTIPYAQGWHPYFSLGESIDNCTLQINANNMVEFDDTLLPTGNIIQYKKFITALALSSIELDNCFVLETTPQQPACTLANNILALHVYNNSNYPYLQVYTPPHRQSIAIENLSGAPDCFNNGIGLTLIEPNSSIIFVATYQAVLK